MNKFVFAGVAVGLLAVVAVPASAADRQATENTPSTAPASAKTPPEKKYCVIDTVTGTRIPQKTCKTRKEWMRDEGIDPLDR